MNWIRVEDGLPDHDNDVLIYMHEHPFKNGPRSIVLGRYEAWRQWWRPRGSNGNFADQVTHWMPLPEAPQS